MSDTKNIQRKIEISELPAQIPDFTSTFEPKDSIIKKWFIDWILSAISKNKIKENDILPTKSEISNYLGVSIGTVQNAIRYVEDEGFLKSKQKLGTMISNCSNPSSDIIKSTSRRDKAVIAIKNYIIQKDIEINKSIPSIRKMAEYLGVSQNTTRLAFEHLKNEGIIKSKQIRGNDSNWILAKYPKLSKENLKVNNTNTSETLVVKLTEQLKYFISENFNVGDKIPSHEELAKKLNVSVKTIHDCIKKLNEEGILLSRRGQYGTTLAQNPLKPIIPLLKENSIFSKAEDAAFYNYQRIENKLINLIKTEFKAGDKLPSMKDLSKKFDVSTNTIRKSLNAIAQQGYVTFTRGRFGGTFIVDIPETLDRQTYQWISINPDYI